MAEEFHGKRRGFFRVYGPPAAVWFLWMPTLAIVGHFVSPWVRFRVVYFLTWLMQFVSLVAGLYIMSASCLSAGPMTWVFSSRTPCS